ncbi:MAG: HAD-IA family hydrolase [Streptococcaceae bacterium]|jgi:HAD superfamily hydrolase (TIGR01549 family)|nr:HAD-IA family hydrolase [Streptococcaceae bacterium]
MIYKNYIWDLGGTLLNNYEASTHAFVTVLFRHGVVCLHDEIYAALKISTAYAVEQFASNIPDFLAEYKKQEAVSLEKPILFDGAKETLGKIIEAGGKNFMISHRDKQVLSILENAEIVQYFSEVVTSDNKFPRKPKPDSINYLLEKYKLDKHETVMIGDREIDIEAGKSAGSDTIFFDSLIENQQATYSIHSLREVF